MGLLDNDPTVVHRGTLLPLLRRSRVDGPEGMQTFQNELAVPGVLYDAFMNMGRSGQMLMGERPFDEGLLTQTILDAPFTGGLLAGAAGMVPKGAVLGANVGGKSSRAAHARPLNPTKRTMKGINDSPDDIQPSKDNYTGGPKLSKSEFDEADYYRKLTRKQKYAQRQDWGDEHSELVKENARLLDSVDTVRLPKYDFETDPLIVQSNSRENRLREIVLNRQVSEFMNTHKIDNQFNPRVSTVDTDRDIQTKLSNALYYSNRAKEIATHPGKQHWNKKFFEDIEKEAQYADYGSVEKAINRANMEAVPRLLKKQGWTVRHASKDKSGKASSRYLVSSDGTYQVRLSDHELPDTPAREYSRAQFGGPNWDDEVVLSGSLKESPQNVADEIMQLYLDNTELSANPITASVPGLFGDVTYNASTPDGFI